MGHMCNSVTLDFTIDLNDFFFYILNYILYLEKADVQLLFFAVWKFFTKRQLLVGVVEVQYDDLNFAN